MEPSGYCPKCDYRTDVGVCPECGLDISTDMLRESPRTWWDRHGRWVKRAALGLVLAIGGLFTVAAIEIGFHPNVGLPFGYYARLNRVKSRIKEIPHAQILHLSCNYDLTIEEIDVRILIDTQYEVTLSFPQAPFDPQRDFFDHQGGVVIGWWRKAGEGQLDDRNWNWRLQLGSDSDLGKTLGCQLFTVSDVLANLAAIIEHIETAPDDELDATWNVTPEASGEVYIRVTQP